MSSKKRKATAGDGDDDDAKKRLLLAGGYQPLSLQDILKRIEALCERVPVVPESGFKTAAASDNDQKQAATGADNGDKKPSVEVFKNSVIAVSDEPITALDKTQIRQWASGLQLVLEEFLLLVACLSPATYRWGSNRSGAADQNLQLLNDEFVKTQQDLASRVTPRLQDVLAPAVTLVTDRTLTKSTEEKGGESTNNGNALTTRKSEEKQNYFTTTLEDPDYVDLCFQILARNSHMLRHVVLANWHKLVQCLKDYIKAEEGGESRGSGMHMSY